MRGDTSVTPAASSAIGSAPFERSYEGALVTLHQARSDVSSWLRACGADDGTIERVALIASELASNAVQATPGRSYHLRLLSVGWRRLELTVRSDRTSESRPPLGDWGPKSLLAPQGRGLAIVAALSEDVRVLVDDDQVVVRVRIPTTSPA